MKSLEVPIPSNRMRGVYSFDVGWLMVRVARHRLPALVPGHEYTQVELDMWAEALEVDSLEDVFALKHLSVDLVTGKATLFYEDNYSWCIEHQMYVSEDRHQGLHKVQVTEVWPGTPEWEASEILLERQRKAGG